MNLEHGTTPKMKHVKKLHLYQQVLMSKERAITKAEKESFEDKLKSIIDSLSPKISRKSFGKFKVAYENKIEKSLFRQCLSSDFMASVWSQQG